jgi:hypothetical protein
MRPAVCPTCGREFAVLFPGRVVVHFASGHHEWADVLAVC